MRHTWVWQLLEDQISTCHLLGPAHTGHCWAAGSGECPWAGTRLEELCTAASISCKQPLKDPPRILQGPILSASYPSLPLKAYLSPLAEDSGASLDQAWLQRPPHTGSSPTWVWSRHSRSALIHFILSLLKLWQLKSIMISKGSWQHKMYPAELMPHAAKFTTT